MKLAERYMSLGSPCVFRVGRKTVLKIGTAVRTTEATTMLYVAQNTRVPVPTVVDSWVLEGRGAAILMEWVDSAGTLESLWPSLSQAARTRIAGQVRGYVDELRKLEQPLEQAGYIGPIDRAELWDSRVKMSPCGPFPSEEAFNDFRLKPLRRFCWDPETNEQVQNLARQLRGDHRICFTHGDLNARNILLDRDNNVVALLDWEMAGWMPEHWEHIKAIHGRWEDEEWVRYAPSLAPAYPSEMEVDDQFIIINGGAPF